jgi:EmrB/QacA subfamily drug resistance transporter
MAHGITHSQRWLALYILCLGVLMIVLDGTIVNVALPSIREDLAFTETSLVWVVNAYLLTFGGFLLLGGRLGDLLGHRRVFLIGLAVFTLASAACGLANSQAMLIIGRAVQGIGGAVVSAAALSLIMNVFTEPGERAKAMGVYGFVCSGGGSIGVLLGGVLTGSVGWHWIFLVNVPIGIVVYVLCARLIPAGRGLVDAPKLDVAGAVTVTVALMLAVYAVVNGNEVGWMTVATMWKFGVAFVLFVIFMIIESRVASPLMPMSLFKLKSVSTANIVAVLWAAGMFAWFFISALYLQLVLERSPMEVGLAFLPANLIMAACSLGISAKLVMKFGLRGPLVTGVLCVAGGLLLFARAPVDGNVWIDVIPAMSLLGFGCGIAFNPLLLAAMNDVPSTESGLASGMVNTSFMMGGALGLAVIASIAAAHTAGAPALGAGAAEALNSGYRLAFAVGAGFAILAAVIAAVSFRKQPAAGAVPAGGHGD